MSSTADTISVTQKISDPTARAEQLASRRRIPKSGSVKSDVELRQACQEFEEIFIRYVLKEAHVDRSLFSEKGASSLYADMMREALAKAMSKGGGFGLADVLYQQLSKSEGSLGQEVKTGRDRPAADQAGVER